jgi:hypothetical protein
LRPTETKTKSKEKKVVENISKTEKKSFKYTAFDNSFDLEIVFNRDNFEKKDILRALKEAFEKIKNS